MVARRMVLGPHALIITRRRFTPSRCAGSGPLAATTRAVRARCYRLRHRGADLSAALDASHHPRSRAASTAPVSGSRTVRSGNQGRAARAALHVPAVLTSAPSSCRSSANECPLLRGQLAAGVQRLNRPARSGAAGSPACTLIKLRRALDRLHLASGTSSLQELGRTTQLSRELTLRCRQTAGLTTATTLPLLRLVRPRAMLGNCATTSAIASSKVDAAAPPVAHPVPLARGVLGRRRELIDDGRGAAAGFIL
jgi:hypothetical protein